MCAHAPTDPSSVRGMRATERTAAAEVAPAGTGSTGAVAEEEVRPLSAVAAGPPTHRGGAA